MFKVFTLVFEQKTPMSNWNLALAVPVLETINRL